MEPEEEKKLIGTDLFDRTMGFIGDVGGNYWQEARTIDNKYNPFEYIEAGLARTIEGVGHVASAPGISHALRVIDSPFWVARQAAGGVLEHGLGVDPRYGHTAVGIAELIKGPVIATKATKLLKSRTLKLIDAYNPGMVAANTGSGFGDVGKIKRFVPPTDSEIGKVQQILLNNALLGPERKFNWNAYRNALTSSQKRVVASAYSSTPYSKIATSWKDHRKLLMDSFETVYGEAMVKRGIPSSQIDIDHLYTLVQSMGVYDDVVYGSKLWNQIQEKILSRGYKAGDAVDNLAAIEPGTHMVKTAFFNKLHGKNGTKFFTRNRLKNMDRLELLDMYLDQVDEGTRILNEGMKVFDTLYTNRNLIPEELVERLADIVVGPEGQLPMYTTPELRNIIKQIKKDITERPDIKGPNIRNLLKEFEGYNPDLDVFLKSSPESLEMLVARIEGATPRQLKKRFKGYNPDQLELAFDTLTPTMVARIKKAYGLSGKGGTPF